ncbi:2-C-methyl-D-erythritol 4-phosphate cytidylyltransferase [candidate division KSB1 bacterium]
MKKFVLILAGGTGQRMLNEIPKQFILLNQKPILQYSIQAFFNSIPEINIIIVLPESYFNMWFQLCDTYQINIPHQTVKGGITRFESVKNGLKLLPDDGLVAIHDGVRPFVSKDMILQLFHVAENYGNSIPAIQIDESVRIIEKNQNRLINRKSLRIIQTPQCFDLSILKKAYQQEYNESFTDDASVLENIGIDIHLIEGSRKNIKITFPDDLAIAEFLLLK